jgi:hypothetical protein
LVLGDPLLKDIEVLPKVEELWGCTVADGTKGVGILPPSTPPTSARWPREGRERAPRKGRRSVRTYKKIRCSSCKKRIGSHEPDLVLENLTDGKRRYFHTHCDEMITNLILERLAPCQLTIRHVEAERN